ncbi:FAD-dependent oxidoreductase [Paraconexibacter antarcticus]|uniref:FAD-dependent oxidoreductase n=1 Tax=Paraconexibacter antarcticus TaxID=2949664 RepID=UPI002665B7D6|nr:FAD-dependent oxidoreductase [Paraconexibacter antarcticus]
MSDTVVVIGGGPAGIEAARNIADLGMKAVLVEERERLGGTPIFESYAALTPHFDDAEEAMDGMIAALAERAGADVRTNSTVTAISGEAGDFVVTVDGPSGSEEVAAGAVVLCTGFTHFDPGRERQIYNYYQYPDVLALQDLEVMLKAHDVRVPSTGKVPERICWVQCVGSRDRNIGNEYCSKVCCGVASKQAIEVRKIAPDSRAYIFYIDMRMYGYWEQQIYWPAQEQYHVQYIKGIITEILEKQGGLIVRGEDTTMGRPMEVAMDMVVLSVGMEPSEGTKTMAGVLGVEQNKYGFIEVARPPLDTVSTNREGIFAAGAALGPADLEDTISSAGAAASKAVALIRRGSPAVV